MAPLLQAPLINPHATLITLFMNVVDENMTRQDQMARMTHGPTTKRLWKYLPPPKGMSLSPNGPEVIKSAFALESVATYDHIFDR